MRARPLTHALRLVSLVGVAALAAGCQSYYPAPATPAPGVEIRAHLTPAAALRETERTGAPKTAVEGRLLGVDDGELVLSVPLRGIVPEYQRSPKVADTLRISRSEVTALEERRLSKLRTAAAMGAIAAVAIIAIEVADPGGDATFRPPGDGPNNDRRIPLLTFRIGR